MDIKVGDKVTTPDGKAHVVVSAGLSVGGNYIFSRGNEPVTDTSQAVPDYNNGEWHGWNGGECPVHGKSEVECEIGWREKRKAEEFVWDYRGPSEIIAFRVTKPYVEPKLETVTLYGHKGKDKRRYKGDWNFQCNKFAHNTHRITFNTIDGEPDPASIKMERMRD